MTTKEILTQARALLEAGFTQGTFASVRPITQVEWDNQADDDHDIPGMCGINDPDVCCYCSQGAVYQVIGAGLLPTDASVAAFRALLTAAGELFPEQQVQYDSTSRIIVQVNDRLGKEAALKMFDRAIELSEAKEAA